MWKSVANSQEKLLHFNKYINKNNNSSTMVWCREKNIKPWIHMAIVLNDQKLIKTSETKASYNYI